MGANSQCRRDVQGRALQLVVGERFKLAGRADLSALDPLARQNAHLSDRGHRRAELTAFPWRARALLPPLG
jgi:hypothetical protein